MLESQHFTVLKSLNGKMALQAAHRNPPDLILLDINMPEMSGYEVCQELKASPVTANIPIIFISALDQVNDKVRAFEMGGQDYITKPFQELEVLARIKNQLIIQQQKQQLQQEVETRQQAELQVQLLNATLKHLNADLEQQVQARTRELQQALNFEFALKQITEQVRDSLDQHQIIQTAVETLAQALDVHCCDAALYSADHSNSLIRYQWIKPGLEATQGQTLYMADYPEVYEQLQKREYIAFCQIQPTPIRNHSAILACPIFDDEVEQTGILGDLWLFREKYSGFSEAEIRLAQQTANQCAIALRQARLYEAAQAQVKELERLNQLKDDFLSTISHELRTPIASMKMVINLLTNITDQGHSFIEKISPSSAQSQKVIEYFKVLEEECDRELDLIEDLLNLQHIQAGTYVDQIVPINLQDFLPHLAEPFESRLQAQNQTLQFHLASDAPIFNVDLLSFNRVVTEMLNNACKYTPAGETISISTAIAQAENAANAARYLELTITNSGAEIAAEEQSRIFDKFYRIPNHDPWKHGGTGLGLALVKKLVEQMGGKIEVKSSHQQTSFILSFEISS